MAQEFSGSQSRSSLCKCGSGKKYKRCCIRHERKERAPISNEHKNRHSSQGIEFFTKVMNALSQETELLRNYCKDEGFYYFECMKVNDKIELLTKLDDETLSKEFIFEKFKKNTTREYLDRILLGMYCDSLEAFTKRKNQIKSTIDAHFEQKYELSIISFFVLIEGILRDIGDLLPKEKIRPTIPRGGHEEDGRYMDADSIGYFNAYITKLFEGSTLPEEFNRNTILHGFNLNSFNEYNSLTLLLTLLEIGKFTWNRDSLTKMLRNEYDVSKYMLKHKDEM